MTSPASPSTRSPTIQPDRVGIIRRSQRCFIFGLFGLVPFFGLGLAWQAIRLHRELAKETGESPDLTPFNRCLIVSVFALALFFLMLETDDDRDWAVLALGFLLPIFQGALFWQQHQRSEPPYWNPGRNLAYWGVWLAFTGLILSATFLIVIVDALLR